jgi:purine-binding chemotaxis protein CheW
MAETLNRPMTESNQLLCVRLGDQEFALNIRGIREIRGWISSTPLPHAPSYIKGMINLRGSVLAIIDLAERLGLPSVPPDGMSVVVVIEHGEHVIGLLVDAVSDIIIATEDMRQVAPETGSAASRDYVEGLLMRDKQIISVLSIPVLMPKDARIEAELEAAQA